MGALKNEHTALPESDSEKAHRLMHDFAAHLMNAREEERKRLANEIHDKLGQNLLALRIDVSRLHAITIDSHPRINSKASDVLEDLDVAIQNIKGIINHLRPPVLDLGLVASVEWKVNEFERYSGIPCLLRTDGDDGDYEAYDRYALPVTRILQESLTNVARHAKADTAEVSLSRAESKLTLNIQDDGIGICPDDLSKPKSYGLLAIRKYVNMLNGEFIISKNELRTGTLLTIAIPKEN